MNAELPLREMKDWAERSVILLPRHWDHICEAHQDLPAKLGGVANVLAAIEQTLRGPDEVRKDAIRPDVFYVYRRIGVALFLRVIIWYVGSEAGEIRTAHLAKKPGRKEVLVWRSTPDR